MLPIQIGKMSHASLSTGQGSADGTAKSITASPTPAKYGVFVRNHDGANALFVGNSKLTAGTGFQIIAGEDLWIPVEDPRIIYVITGGAAVAYSYLVV